MNFKLALLEGLALISLGVSRGAQVGKTSLLEVEFITAQASMLGVFIFDLIRDVLTAPSNVYLILGSNLFHSYF